MATTKSKKFKSVQFHILQADGHIRIKSTSNIFSYILCLKCCENGWADMAVEDEDLEQHTGRLF
jgi:hypothetical protein